MRQFVVVGHEAPTEPSFSLDNLGGAGRLDLLCRCLNSALFVSHGIREDVRVHLVLSDTYTLSVDGETVRQVHPDERSIAARVREALEAAELAIGHQPAEPAPGIALYRMGLAATLERLATSGTLVTLDPAGTPVVAASLPEAPIFVLSDHQPFAEDERALLADWDAQAVSLGPRAIHADDAIAIAHNALDTDGFQQY